MASEALRNFSPISASLFLIRSSVGRLGSSIHYPVTVLRINLSRTTTTWKLPAEKASIRCSGSPNQTLRTCKNCKTQFDPLLNHSQACRFHTAHFGVIEQLDTGEGFRNSFLLRLRSLFSQANSHSTILSLLFHVDFQQYQLPLLLQTCTRAQSLDTIKSLHALITTTGSEQPIFVFNNLLSAYASMGKLLIARNVFENMPERNAVSYNSIIATYCRNDHGIEAWKLFSQMMASGLKPTQFTFGSLLSLSSLDLHQGYQLHTLILKLGLLYVDAFSGTALLGLFQRHGSLDEALKLFEDIPQRNIVTWNSLISAFSQCGFVEDSIFLFRELLRSEIRPSESSFVGIFSGFGCEPDFEFGEQIHGLVIKSGTLFYPSVANSVVNMYAKCSHPCLAEKMFEDVPSQDVISWNVIIGVLLRSEKPQKALELFWTMLLDGFLPNQTTFVGAISSCASLQIPKYGKLIHGKVIKNNFNSDVFVGTALIDLYAKCCTLEEAHLCFDEIYEKNLVTWNALIAGYSSKYSPISVYLVREMLHLGYRPNEFSFSSVVKSSLAQELQQVHSLIIRMGYFHNEYVLSCLIASYATNGLLSEALCFATDSTLHLPVVASNIVAGIYNRTGQYQETQRLLSCLEEPDDVSWNILISACAHNGDYMEVFDLFKSMQISKTPPDKYTVTSLLCICSKLNGLALGSSVHGFIIKNEVRCCDVFVCNILIDMYSKCGSIGSAVKVFNELRDRNTISWTALISALGLHGYAHEALKSFREMEVLGFKPDKVTFIAVLSACRHGGLVEEGKQFFRCMKQMYRVEPEMDHYECVVDLLSRSGNLQEAGQLISRMPFQPNAIIWRSFLAGCERFKNKEEQVVVQESKLDQANELNFYQQRWMWMVSKANGISVPRSS